MGYTTTVNQEFVDRMRATFEESNPFVTSALESVRPLDVSAAQVYATLALAFEVYRSER